MPRAGAVFPYHITDLDLAWAAGLFEGEGCVLHRSDGSYTITLRMTDLDVIERFHSIMGGTLHGPYPSTKPEYKVHWEWAARGRSYFLRFYEVVGPLLGSRRRQRLTEGIAAMGAIDALAVSV